ncbi:MAG: hypothetical protein EAZ54_10770, partial [Curvibacter sp.]
TLVRERQYTVAESNGRRRSRLILDARYFLNGQPQSKEKFTLDGTIEVRELQRYFDSGKLRFQGSFVAEGRYNERAIGVHLSYFENGKTESENSYDDKGNIKRQRVWDANGVLRSDDELFEDGSRKAVGK